MNPFPYILATITRKPRYQVKAGVNFKWNSQVVHNIFRVYELIFGRKYGVRCEAYSDSNGNYKFFTIEARLAHYETVVKSLFKVAIASFSEKLRRLWFPEISNLEWQRGAIAFGAIAETSYSVSATQTTGSITVSGSDTLGIGCFHDQSSSTSISSATFNSVAMTAVTNVAEGG